VLDLRGDTISAARIALGGIGTIPWRATGAEASLMGRTADDTTFRQAADAAMHDARPREHNAFKIGLAKRTLVRALAQAAQMKGLV